MNFCFLCFTKIEKEKLIESFVFSSYLQILRLDKLFKDVTIHSMLIKFAMLFYVYFHTLQLASSRLKKLLHSQKILDQVNWPRVHNHHLINQDEEGKEEKIQIHTLAKNDV